MQERITAIRKAFQEEIEAASSAAAVESIQIKYLGKKGLLQPLMRDLKELSTQLRPQAGREINDLKNFLVDQCESTLNALLKQERSDQLRKETIDISLPGKRQKLGCKHLIQSVMEEMIDVLVGMGFSIQDGPEIETDYHNFEALNFPPDHPARDMQDTFYVAPNLLLRTHTSNVQVRVMESSAPPIRIIAPGRCYRNEAISSRSHVFFHQIEAIYIDEGVTFAHLLSTLETFLQKIFQPDVVVRFRPSFFPFVEPGLEVDIRCSLCKGKGCSMCKQAGWLEVLGAGMVHPDVLKNGGIDPEQYTGFAWGLGVERIASLKYHVRDIRLFSENDIRFLQQFQAV